MVNFKFGFLRVAVKNSERYCLEDLNLNQIHVKEVSLKCQAAGFRILGQLRGSRGCFLALGRMTYSHFPNRIFI